MRWFSGGVNTGGLSGWRFFADLMEGAVFSRSGAVNSAPSQMSQL